MHDAQLRSALERHRDLEQSCNALVTASLGEDPKAFAARWNAVERALTGHMTAEEELLFSMYELSEPEVADALRAEHAMLRALIREIDAHVRSQGVHIERLRRLVEQLHANVVHEEASVYRWAKHA
jgi:hemerythrin superfamily protein